MSPKNTEHEHARELYLNTDKTQQEIADILNINRRTIYLWIKKGKWEEMKLAARQAPGIILQDFYNHITEINDQIRDREDRCPTMQEVEKMRKLLGMAHSIKKRHMGVYLEVLEELVFYIARQDIELGRKVTALANNYVKGNFGDECFYLDKERDENIARVVKNLKKEEEEEKLEERANTNAGQPVSDTPTPPVTGSVTPGDGQPCDNNEEQNGTSCDNNVTTKTIDRIMWERMNALPAEDSGDLPPAETPNQYPISDFSADEISPELDKILKLPLAHRPSPFRDGNTLWVINIDDVEERYNNLGQEWGEYKMGDRIKRYSDIAK